MIHVSAEVISLRESFLPRTSTRGPTFQTTLSPVLQRFDVSVFLTLANKREYSRYWPIFLSESSRHAMQNARRVR
jgi:hypothetical protein